MKAFTFAVIGWLTILCGWMMSPGDMPAGTLISSLFFAAAVIAAFLGLGGRQQRAWNVVGLILCIPFLLGLAALIVGGRS